MSRNWYKGGGARLQIFPKCVLSFQVFFNVHLNISLLQISYFGWYWRHFKENNSKLFIELLKAPRWSDMFQPGNGGVLIGHQDPHSCSFTNEVTSVSINYHHHVPEDPPPHPLHPQPRPDCRDSRPDQVCGLRSDRLHHRRRRDYWQCTQSCRPYKAQPEGEMFILWRLSQNLF